MKALDHDTFHSLEIDALYDELDAPSSSAIREHAASCESCASRLERLRRARQRGLSVLAEAVPQDFESRVMAAVDAALAKRAGGPVLVAKAEKEHGAAPPPQVAPRAGAGAKVIPFFARPSFAVAATLVLVLGAATILSQMGLSKKMAPMASSGQTPAVAATAAVQPDLAASATTPATEAIALGESQGADGAKMAPAPAAVGGMGGAPHSPPAAKPSMLAAQDPFDAKPTKAARPAGAARGAPVDPAFAAAKALYDAGRYAEALPRFEALKANNPEADLYAARCIQKTRGCTAAAPRFDATAKRNSGTEIGSRAQLEAGTCYRQIGQAQAARARYQAVKDEGFLSSEAASDLDMLDREAAPAAGAAPAATSTAHPGTPGAGRPASPKAPAPVPAEAPLNDSRQ